MKILFITNYLSPYRVDFFNELGKKSDLTVWSSHNVNKARDSKWFNNNYQNFKIVYTDGGLKYKLSLVKSIQDYDVTMIGTYTEKAAILSLLYAKIKKLPLVLEIDGGIPANGKGIKEWFKRFLISIPVHYLSPSDAADDYLKFYGAKPEKIFRYPFTSSFAYELLNTPPTLDEKIALKKELGISEEKMVVSIGQFIPRKGNDVLIKATHIADDSSTGVYIIGGKPTDEYLELKETLGLKNLHFEDFKVKQDLAKWYKAADLFVLPTREDIWGLVINEAMQFGLPIITTNRCVAGLELVGNGKNGYIVNVDDPDALAGKMKDVLQNDELCHAMAEESLKKITGHTIEEMVSRHLEIFDKILSN